MEKVKVLVVVENGVARIAAPDFVDARIVDLDNIRRGDGPAELPRDDAWKALVKQAGLRAYPFVPVRYVKA